MPSIAIIPNMTWKEKWRQCNENENEKILIQLAITSTYEQGIAIIHPFDYFFWDFVKTKVYAGRKGKPFSKEEELQREIRAVWQDCAADIATRRKAIRQLIPRLKAVREKNGHSIKMLLGKNT